jgi:hypothetical protein
VTDALIKSREKSTGVCHEVPPTNPPPRAGGKREGDLRPALRYHGGKWKLAPWLIEHFPAHRVYVEPFSGGGECPFEKEAQLRRSL